MCEKCYQELDVEGKMEMIYEIRKINILTYDFSKWNSTSWNFLMQILNDSEMKEYHSEIVSFINKFKWYKRGCTFSLVALLILILGSLTYLMMF